MRLRQKVADSILHDFIESGVCEPGGKLPSLRSMVSKYGASSGTINSAILLLESHGIVRSQRGSGCYVTANPLMASSSRQNAIGVIVSMLHQGYVLTSRILAGVDRGRQEMGFELITSVPSEWSYDVERDEVERLKAVGCKGIVMVPAVRSGSQISDDYLRSRDLDYPIVLIDPSFHIHKRSQVLFDNFGAGFEMTNYLMKNGHERIAFMAATIPGTPGDCSLAISERFRGYTSALKLCGKNIHPGDRWEFEEDLEEFGVRHIAGFIRDWRELSDRPTAVIAVEDGHAVTTINIAREMGVAVPDDLEVVGFDDLPLARQIRPHIATTHPDGVEAGRQAVRLAYQHITGELEQPRTLVLPVSVLTRDTRSLDDLLAPSDDEMTQRYENQYVNGKELNVLK